MKDQLITILNKWDILGVQPDKKHGTEDEYLTFADMIMHDIINKVDIAQFRGDLKSAILDYFGLTIGDHYSEENFLINSELIFNLLKDSGVSHHQ